MINGWFAGCIVLQPFVNDSGWLAWMPGAGISVCILKSCINNYVKIYSFTRNVITAC
jgi:hypothetical protein